MMVKMLLPQNDADARRIVSQFKSDGIASLSTEGMHFGFIRQVGEEKGRIVLVADVTEPDWVAWIKDNAGEGEQFRILSPGG
ncbi:MAG: hypothetical protein SA339_09700 [Methanomassiliicoccus sp.]|nr:hypothetical protein [Methanomassiliicoccus sp.]